MYIHVYIIYIYISELSSFNQRNVVVSSCRHSSTKHLKLPSHLLRKFYSISTMVTNIRSIKASYFIYGRVLDYYSHLLIFIAPIPSNIMFAAFWLFSYSRIECQCLHGIIHLLLGISFQS